MPKKIIQNHEIIFFISRIMLYFLRLLIDKLYQSKQNMQRSFEEVNRSNINNSRSKQAHAFPHQPRFVTTRITCPQAFYDLNPLMMSSQIKKKSKSFSQSARDLRVKTPSPGPFAYRVKSFLEQNNSKKIGSNFSQSKRQPLQKRQRAPGPGAYSPNIIKDKQPTFTIGSKLQHPLSKSFIGPGQYQTQKYNSIANSNNFYSKYTKSQTFKMGSQKRFHSPSFAIPAPNQYAFKNLNHNQTFSFGKQKRHSIIEGSHRTPGPGAYHQFSEFAERRRRLQSNLRKMQTVVKEK